MRDEAKAYVHDIHEAGRAVKQFVHGRSFDDYAADELLRSAVERKFEIMGEAMNRIQRTEPELLAGIRYHRDIISFRNILIHGYDTIDDRVVWGVIREDLDRLIEDTRNILGS